MRKRISAFAGTSLTTRATLQRATGGGAADTLAVALAMGFFFPVKNAGLNIHTAIPPATRTKSVSTSIASPVRGARGWRKFVPVVLLRGRRAAEVSVAFSRRPDAAA